MRRVLPRWLLKKCWYTNTLIQVVATITLASSLWPKIGPFDIWVDLVGVYQDALLKSAQFFLRLGPDSFAKKFVTESASFFKHKVWVVPKSFLCFFFALSLSMANPQECVGEAISVVLKLSGTRIIQVGLSLKWTFFEGTCFWWMTKRGDTIIDLTLLSTLVTLRVHVEPTSKVFCLLHFGGF